MDAAVFKKPLSDFMFSVRVQKLCDKLKLATAGDLAAKHADDLLEVKGIGGTSLQEVRDALASVGLELGMPVPVPLEDLPNWKALVPFIASGLRSGPWTKEYKTSVALLQQMAKACDRHAEKPVLHR